MSIFKAYDIRGTYPDQLNEDIAKKISIAYAYWSKAKKVIVGYDMRPESPSLFKAVCEGLISQGVNVVNIGLCSTPINYFANGHSGSDGSIMITASHNGPGWNGLKMCLKGAVPMSYEKGLKEIREMVESDNLPSPAPDKGSVVDLDYSENYGKSVQRQVKFSQKPKIVIDYGNAMGIKEMEPIEHLFDIIPLYKEYDGTFPNHEANPLDTSTLKELQKQVVAHKADFGAAFDGDADRCGFVDNTGKVVSMDLITALIAEDLLEQERRQTILFDLRSSKAVPEAIEKAGGIAKMTRVGHALIKEDMRRENASFAGELSGHYYFRDNFFSESQARVVVILSNLLEKHGKSLEELIRPLRKYSNTGEINRPIASKDAVLSKIKETYKDAHQYQLDGLTVEYKNWWCNVRGSNTEPKLRIFIEAEDEELLNEKREEVLALIDSV